ncbi:MAG TPA: LLM class flavin-dependent oxidoreductase [Actinomycetota bacterium]|nr:LLM class flavin-dependent oxidoreductase [Actinomycetota bacterium]
MTAARQPRGLGVALRDPLPWDELAGVVREGERLGYAAVFLPEIVARDAFAALTGLAGETTRMLLGTGVVPMRSRTAVLTAMAAATVHERSGGRLVLGIGTGSVGSGALVELERTVVDVRALLSGEVTRDGRARRLTLTPGSEVPIWISAMGPRAFELGGRIADGVLLNWCTPERVAFARAAVADGARAADRDPAEITVATYVRSWVGEDEAGAATAMKAAAGEYARYPAYARQFAQLGMRAEAQAAAAAVTAGRPEDVPDAMIHAFTAFGEHAPARLAEYAEAGADLVLVYPVAVGEPAPSILGTVRALAPSVG